MLRKEGKGRKKNVGDREERMTEGKRSKEWRRKYGRKEERRREERSEERPGSGRNKEK